MSLENQTVLFLCGYSAPYGGNFIPSLLALEDSLRARGGRCLYVFPREARSRAWAGKLEALGKTVEFIDFSAGRLSFLRALLRLIRAYGVTVFHAHFAPILTVEILSLVCPGVSFFIHIHSDFSAGANRLSDRLRSRIRLKLMCGHVRFFSVTPSFLHYNPGRIRFLPNALAVQRLTDVQLGREEVRRMAGVEPQQIFLELFGWSPYVKGVDIAVDALQRLVTRERLPLVLGIICGTDTDVREMKDWIRQNTCCSGDEDFLRFLPPTDDVFGYHQAADFLLSASRSEGFPYSVLEMLSLGKPCIVSDIPGIQWARDFSAVRVFRSGSADDCARCILDFLPERALRFPDTAEQISSRYNIHSWVSSILAEYESGGKADC